jgi:adenosylcobinamide amidohydrolase
MAIVIFLLIIPVIRNLGIVETTYGWQQTVIGTYENGDTFESSLLSEYDFVLATWKTLDNDPIENYTVLFRTFDLSQGNCTRTRIQTNPTRFGCLNHNTLGTINVGVVTDQNNVDATFNSSVTLVGIKMISVF